MANSIAKGSTYVPLLDEVYKLASLTSDLDGAAELARAGANVDEMIIPKISMDGLANYSRNSGYVSGDVTMVNETVKCNYDRGRMFTIDNVDNMETAGVAFGRLANEFIRTKVVPELDAFRFATYAGLTGISAATPAALTTADAVIKALRAASTKMDEDEVPSDQRFLYITATLHGMLMDLESYKSKQVLETFSKVVKVPQTRFYTKIKLNNGTSEGETGGGFSKDSTGKNINFLIVHKPAVIQYQKHVAPKIVTPELNQNADAYKFGYRNVGIADAYENKLAGIYLHAGTT